MSTEMKLFENSQFGKLRVVEQNREMWFVGKDVAEALGYERTADAIRVHVDEDDKGVGELPTPGGRQQVVLINESGLYSHVLSSKLESAKAFKRWVTSEVLPSIRRHGGYLTPEKVDCRKYFEFFEKFTH